jgi:hypothetical protein
MDANLTADEERQLREVLAADPDAGGFKDGFCRCWPAVKNMLEWLGGRPLPGKIKAAIQFAVDVGDLVFKTLGCGKLSAT